MKKINQKAFTLIEILATVTILGVLSVVAMVSVNKIIQSAKEKHYTNAEDQLELAGQSYVQQYRSALPKAVGQKVKIPMEKLVNTNYIEQIKDYSDNNCDMKNSYVQVFKYSQKDYSYIAYLDCPVYKSTDHLKEAAPNIVLITEGSTMGSEGKKEEKQTLSIKINPEGDENTEEKPAKLISYSYIIYKYDKEVKNSGSIALPNYETRLNKAIDLTPYAPGKLKIVVTATNIYGLTTTKTATTDYKDTTGPSCLIDENDLPSNPKEWGKNPVKITVGCIDQNGSGCTREKYTKTFKNSATTGFVTIEDLAGNKTKCEVSVNIDLTPPTVPTITVGLWANNNTEPTTATGLTKYTNDTWTNKNLFTEPKSTDANVGLKHYEYVLTGKEGNETVIASKRSITTEGTSTIKYRACDLLDNCSEYSSVQTIKLDKTAPTIPTITLVKWADNNTRPTSTTGLAGYANNTWTNLSIYTVPSSPEEGDDTSKLKEYQYTTTGATENKTNAVQAYRSIEAEGDSTIKYRTCDNAGNCSDYSTTYTTRIDKTLPTITINTPEGEYQTNDGITIESSCTDDRSGVASQTGSSTLPSPSNQDVTHTCTDNAGNVNTATKNYKVYYHSRHPDCGVESWNTCSTGACGVASYRSCANEACGVESYNSCTANVCGAKTCATSSCGCNITASDGSCSQYITCQSYDCGLHSCAHPLCGVASYKTCTNAACGVASYKTCTHPDCGAASYYLCWHL